MNEMPRRVFASSLVITFLCDDKVDLRRPGDTHPSFYHTLAAANLTSPYRTRLVALTKSFTVTHQQDHHKAV